MPRLSVFVVVAGLSCLLVACGPRATAGAPPATLSAPAFGEPAAGGTSVDMSLMPLCRAVLDGDESVGDELAAHPLGRKMSEGMRDQVVFTPEEYAAAAFTSADDPRFSWTRLRANARFVGPFVDHVEGHAAALVTAALARATELTKIALDPDDLRVNLVCGGPWDAYVLFFEQQELFFDVGWLADAPLDEAIPGFEALLAHELWHAAFVAHQTAHWRVDYRESTDPAARFFYEMLNEGVGHYYSMYDHLYPVQRPETAEKGRAAFRLLAERYPSYRDERDAAAREQLLWHSHAGVPFWEKWGAVPGALVVYHLLRAQGIEAVRELAAEEPFSLFVAYAALSARDPSLPQLPPALVRDVEAALAEHRARTATAGQGGR